MSKSIFTGENILKAYFNCRKSKRKSINALKFEMNLEDNLHKLLNDLQNSIYTPGKSVCFVVTKPKPREIFAADFCDRIVHHLFINQAQRIWEEDIFIDDSYACRLKKGNHYGVKKAQEYVKKFRYYGSFDIANFFCSIDKNVVYNIFTKVILVTKRPDWWKNEILWLAKKIIFHNPAVDYLYKGDPRLQSLVPVYKSLIYKDGTVGLPIGNLTSQFLANVYLNEVDHFVTEKLGVQGYCRYVDDFIIFSNSKEELITARNQTSQFLSSILHLQLHPKKQQIQPTSRGVPFVGYFIKPWGITVRRNVVKMLKNKIYKWNKEVDIVKIIPSINSYYGHLGKAKSLTLRKHLVDKHLSLEIKKRIIVVGSCRYFKEKNIDKSNFYQNY